MGCADCSPLRSAQHHHIRDFAHDLTDPQGVSNQMFIVFTVELDSPESARELLEISKQTKRKQTATLGFAKDNVFSLVVASAVLENGESIESGDSLERLSESIGAAMMGLKKHGER